MSSRDIEGENPLYLPQAKVYDGSCALGPCVLVRNEPMPAATQIRLDILRSSKTTFSGTTTLAELKRNPATLVEYLFRDNSFPHGCFLLTGTGIVPPDSFTLQGGTKSRSPSTASAASTTPSNNPGGAALTLQQRWKGNRNASRRRPGRPECSPGANRW